MRLVHISDTHLGFSAYRALDSKTKINQREADFYKAFEEAVKKIIELKPDFVVHTGDLFDSVRPSNKAISFAIESLLKLTKKNIPVVLIAGNHSTPKMHDTGSIFRLFALFDGLYPIYDGRYEKIKIGKATIHAIPQSSSEEALKENFACLKLDTNSSFNILLLHAGVVGIKEFSMGEFNEQLIPESYLKDDFDYIALGHYHKFTQVKQNAYYSGSTERTSFSEADHDKGFIEVDLEKKKVNFHKLNTRPMIDLGPLNAEGLSTEELENLIKETLRKSNLKGKIVRLTINNVLPHVYNSLNFKQIRKLTESALHFELRHNTYEKEEQKDFPAQSLDSLNSEFLNYITSLKNLDKEKKEVLKEMGLSYLERVRQE